MSVDFGKFAGTQVERQLLHDRKDYPRVEREFIEKLRRNPGHAMEWNAGELISANERFLLADRILGAAESDGKQTFEGAIEWFEERVETMLSFVRSSSRSTSVMANLRDDVRNEVWFKLYSTVKQVERYGDGA